MSLLGCAECSTRYASGLERCPHCGSADRTGDGGRVLLPFVDVACGTDGCAAAGVVRRVHLPRIAPGVVEQSTLLCAGCGAVMRTVRSWRDRVTDTTDEENSMAKITVHGGPSNARDDDTGAPAETDTTGPDPEQQVVAEQEVVAEQQVVDSEPLPDAIEGDPSEREAPGIPRPSAKANKGEWVAFAQLVNERGQVDERDPETLTKAELIEIYGPYGEE